MSRTQRITEFIGSHTKHAIAMMLLLTVLVGAGAGQVDQSSSLDQFQSDTEAADKLGYIEENFSTGPDNRTTVQLIVRGDNVLERDTLVSILELEQAYRNDSSIDGTLADNRSIIGVPNLVARTAAIGEESQTLERRGARLQARNQSLRDAYRQLQANRTQLENASARLEADFAQLQANQSALANRTDRLNATAESLATELLTIKALQAEYDSLNASFAQGALSQAEYDRRAAAIEDRVAAAKANASTLSGIDATEAATFNATAARVRSLRHSLHELNVSLANGEITQPEYEAQANEIASNLETAIEGGSKSLLQEEYAAVEDRASELKTRAQALRERRTTLQQRGQELEERAQELQQRQDQLMADFEAFQEDRKALQQSPPSPSLAERIDIVRSMNESQLDRTLDRILVEGGSGEMSGLTFMPTSYEPGETSANATMLIVTQQSASVADGNGGGGQSGMASEPVIDAQLRMQDVAASQFDGDDLETIVFGAGMITEEIDNSMGDSLNIVGPLALFFVLLALIIAYRDFIDILLGVFGIAAVLVWTFGFMGWTGVSFNQMFVAVPVLLIGLSIDYAIHIFMRHREEREKSGNGVRGSMKVALAGVAIALVWVTATTVAGFLSNVTSPIPPIQDFGVVSAFGITATLLVFGVLVPALKVEIDAFLESRGWDRDKRAFGTGGGRFSQVLATGSIAARKAPWVVIALALLVSAGGAYGATHVDTSFNQEDFLAEDPADWTKELPEPFKPGDYTAKQHLEYVNENFLREDSQAQILIEGDPTDPAALRAVDTVAEQAADAEPTKKLAGGGASIQSPLSVMRSVAATNESFNATFTAADTDGDRIPDRNLKAVYDELYAVAGDQAAGVIHRTEDGEYRAVRLVVATSGTASATEVTNAMQPIADDVDAIDGVEATATGQLILFKIIQDQLLDTVIESLLITLVAVFAILMLAYRVTKGSATLGVVTLLPVVFSVSWILGTMALADIPFNVMTGMITSLTVGLGVAYSIHLSERYTLELDRTGSVWGAMRQAVTGTGGALLGSAATTVGGFGVLAFAILPPLQQFGIITGMTIIYAFLASVLVLPSLLIVWTKYVGPGLDSTGSSSETVSAEVAVSEDD